MPSAAVSVLVAVLILVVVLIVILVVVLILILLILILVIHGFFLPKRSNGIAAYLGYLVFQDLSLG